MDKKGEGKGSTFGFFQLIFLTKTNKLKLKITYFFISKEIYFLYLIT